MHLKTESSLGAEFGERGRLKASFIQLRHKVEEVVTRLSEFQVILQEPELDATLLTFRRSAFEESRELFKAFVILIPVQECFSCHVARYSTAQDHEHALQHAAEERAHSLGLMCLCFYDTMRNF